MAANTFGTALRLTSFGESHGNAVGGILDGFPAGINIDFDFLQAEMQRRRPGQSALSSPRNEADKVEFLSGIFEGTSTGSPIAYMVHNKDVKSSDYEHLKDSFRPSHADFTYQEKYGIRDHRGGGRSSARETLARVAGGALAKMMLRQYNIEITAYVSSIGTIDMPHGDAWPEKQAIEQSLVRCPDRGSSGKMIELIEQTRDEGDTLGGVVSCYITGVKPGLGEPVFDKLHAELGKAMLSINAVKGFEYGSGFQAARMKGSEHNDQFVKSGQQIATKTNFSGGIQGGIANGDTIYFRVAFKPVATLMADQQTVDKQGNETTIIGKGRHDVCVVPRAVPIVEAMAALVVADQLLRQRMNQL
jgi:chorismate synthase